MDIQKRLSEKKAKKFTISVRNSTYQRIMTLLKDKYKGTKISQLIDMLLYDFWRLETQQELDFEDTIWDKKKNKLKTGGIS